MNGTEVKKENKAREKAHRSGEQASCRTEQTSDTDFDVKTDPGRESDGDGSSTVKDGLDFAHRSGWTLEEEKPTNGVYVNAMYYRTY